MIRFRFTEDEKRYLALVSALYRNLATHLPPHLVSACMRDLGKLQDQLMLEGVRQGLAVAEVSQLATESGHSDARVLKAFQAHATVYGSQDTPLRNVELEWLEKLGFDPSTSSSAWLDDRPMRFAPDTLEAWEAERPAVDPAPPISAADMNNMFAPRGTDDSVALAAAETGGDEFEGDEPQLLDEARSVLLQATKSGNGPDNWAQMLLLLHRELHVDAGFLDIQMSTPMGRTVLDQCGLYDVRPGRLNLQDLQQQASAQTDDGSSP